MSDRVDKRIVEMQFNNAQFKTGVAETLNMLKNLDKALLFENGQKGFADIQAAANKVDLSSMVKDIDNVEGSLGGLKGMAASVIETVGGIAGTFGKVSGLVGGVMGIGVISKSIQGGLNRAGNLAQAKFTMEGLGITGQRLVDVMDRVNKSVDGTAYGLDAAAVAASSLSASGVTDLDKLETTLKSIAGTAAMTGRDYSDISNIFTTIAGQGKVMTMQLRQLEMSGMNAAAHMASYFGVTEAQIREMVTQGDISFEMFAEAMSTFADQASKANETFTGASANIGSALGRTTADFFEQVMGKQGLVPVLNDVRVFVNGLNTATTSLMHSWTEMGEDAEGNAVEIKHWGAVIDGTNHVLREFNEGFREILQMDEKEKATGEFFTKFKKLFDDLAPSVRRFFAFFANGANEFVHLIANMISIVRAVFQVVVSILDPITAAFSKVFGLSLGNLLGALSDGAAAIADFIDKLALTEPMAMIVQGAFTILFQAIKLVADIVGGALTVAFRVFMGVANFIVDVIHALFEAFGAVNDAAKGLLGGITGFFTSIGGPFGDFFTDIATHMRMFGEGLSSGIPALDAISTLFKGLDYGVIKIFEAFGVALDGIGNAKTFVIDNLKMAFGGLALAVSNLLQFLAPVGEAIYNGLLGGLTEASNFVESTGILQFINDLGMAIQGLLDPDAALGEMGEQIGEASDRLNEFVSGVRDFAEAARDTAIQTFGGVFQTIGNVLTGIKNAVSPVIESIKENALRLFDIVRDAASNVGLSFEPFAAFFQTIFDRVGTFFNGFADGIPTLEDVIEFLGSLKDEFFKLIDDVAPKFGDFMAQVGSDAAEQMDGPLGALVGFVSGLGDALLHLPETIQNIPNALGSMLGDFAHILDHPFGGGNEGGVVGSLQEGVDEISQTGFSLVDSLNFIKSKLKQPWDTVYEFLHDGVDGGLKGIADAINEHLLAINPENIKQFTNSIMGIASAGGSVWALFAVDKFLSNAAMLVGNVANIAYTLDLTLGAVKTAIQNISNAISKDLKAHAFAVRMASIAIAVLAIAGAIYVLSTIEPGKLGVAFAILAGMMGVMTVLMFLLDFVETKLKLNATDTAASFLAMGLSMIAIAKAIEMLGNMDPNALNQGVAAMTGMLVLMGVMVAVAGATGVGIGAAATIMAFAFALGSMIAALVLLPILLGDNAARIITSFVMLGVIIAMLAAACYAIGKAEGPIADGGKAILRISLSLLPIVAALTALTLLGHFDIYSMVTSVFLLILLLGAMAGVIVLLSKFKDTQKFAMRNIVNIFGDLGKTMIALAACIAIVTAVVAMNPGAALIAIFAVIGLLYALTGAMKLLAQAGPQAAAGGKTLMGLAVAMAVLSAAIFVLALLPVEKIVMVAASLSMIMVVMAGLAAVVGHFGPQLDAAVPGILALVVAIGLLAAIMVVLGMDGVVQQAAAGLLVLVGVVLVLVGLAAMVTAMAAVFQVFNFTLIELGIGLALIAAAALMFAAALWIMHDIGVDAVLSTAEELGANTERIQSAAEGIGRALVAGIIGGLVGVIGGIGEALAAGLKGAMDFATGSLADPVNSGVSSINAELQDAVANQDWASSGQEAGKQQAEGQAEGIEQNSDKVEEAGKKTGETAGDASAEAMKDKINSMFKNGDVIDADAGDAFGNEFGEMFDGMLDIDSMTSQFGDLGSNFGDMLNPSIMSGAENNPIDAGELMSNLNLSPDKTEEASKESGEGIGSGLLSGIQEKLSGDNATEIEGAVDAQKEAMEAKSGEFREVGNKVGSAYGEGVGSGVSGNISSVISAVGKTASSMSAGTGAARTSGSTVGAGFGSSVISRIQGYVGQARTASTNVAQSAGSVDSAPYGRGVGRDFGDGYIQGINAKTKAAYEAGVDLAKAAKAGVKAGQDSDSPSKVAMGLGNDFTDGYAIGIAEVGNRVKAAAEGIVDDAANPLSNSLQLMSDLVDLVDWDADPVITPVLDLDNFERGIGRMNSLTASGSLIGASWADRISLTGDSAEIGSNLQNGNNITVILDYKAGRTPNQMVKQLAQELNAANMLGG